MKLIEVDPRELVPNEANVRRELGDLSQLTASITHLGVLQPLGVRPMLDGRYQLRFGHRRRQVAIDLGLATVPCLLAETVQEEDRLESGLRILQTLDENTGRPLTLSEEAAGYAQLSLLDWTTQEIAEFRGVPVAQVKKSLELHRLPQAAQVKADAGVFTLDDALLLAEFDDAPETLAAILARNITGTAGLKHAIEDERRKRDHRRKIEALREQLETAGVAVIDKPSDWPNGTAADVSRLKHADGQYVRAEQVRDQPGFAAFIDSVSHWQDPRVVTVCLDPHAAGLTRLPKVGQLSEQEKAEREARERQRQAYRAALTAAGEVRRQWLATTYGSAAGCKAVLADAVREAVIDADGIASPVDHPLIKKIAGADLASAEKAKLDRLHRLLVGRFLAAQDDNLEQVATNAGGYVVPVQAGRAHRFLSWLSGHGYSGADAEIQLAQDLATYVEQRSDNDGEDEYEEYDEDNDGDNRGDTGNNDEAGDP